MLSFYYSLISVAAPVSYTGTGKDSFRSGKHKQGTSATTSCGKKTQRERMSCSESFTLPILEWNGWFPMPCYCRTRHTHLLSLARVMTLTIPFDQWLLVRETEQVLHVITHTITQGTFQDSKNDVSLDLTSVCNQQVTSRGMKNGRYTILCNISYYSCLLFLYPINNAQKVEILEPVESPVFYAHCTASIDPKITPNNNSMKNFRNKVFIF